MTTPPTPPTSISTPDAERHFLEGAVQYYVAARSAALARLIPVTGNLYHHSLEMSFKARLSQTHSLKTLSRRPFGHDLGELWKAFKADFPATDFSRYDATVSALDQFERIRFPDNIINEGAEMLIAWDTRFKMGSSLNSPPTRRYELDILGIDRLVDDIFTACSRNPAFFMAGMSEYAREAITRQNPVSDRWFTNP